MILKNQARRWGVPGLLFLLLIIGLFGVAREGWALQIDRPLKTVILNAEDQPIARALIYIDYLEILNMNSQLLGKVGITNVEGHFQLFLVKADNQRTLVGWAAHRELYDSNDQLMGYYDWSTFWVYAYSATGQKLGKAKCIAFRGYCAAGIAAFLTGLYRK